MFKIEEVLSNNRCEHFPQQAESAPEPAPEPSVGGETVDGLLTFPPDAITFNPTAEEVNYSNLQIISFQIVLVNLFYWASESIPITIHAHC